MVDVFISYSRANQDEVARLARAVEAEGYSIWWDAELPPHRSYGEVITEQIAGARAAIVVWSPTAAQSEWVRAEADLARNQKKLIQTSLDGAMPPMPFNQIQFASIGDWKGEPDHPGWRKVKLSLAELCGQRGEGAGAPVAFAPAPQPQPAPARGGRGALTMGLLVLLLLVAGGLAFLLTRGSDRPVAVAERPAKEAVPAPAREPSRNAGPMRRAPERPPASVFTHRATIDDPDGYTNVRSGPTAQAPIVARVEEGEIFMTYPQPGGWWQVRTGAGTLGYMSRSRIRLAEGGG
ncbi:TIR domain-containing protein [Allosphingosinicella sp.]|jgi:hypothetical protein|uniref:TIR domain-containing protein n=1 Tax=Allosphingosinicella sp. TaxID=2823234 RepID=UPI002F23740E